MIWIFTVLNGAILHDDQNWSPTYTRIRFLLTELARYEDVWVDSIAYRPSSGPDPPGRLHDNIIKTAVALRSAYRLQKDKPLAFFAYPHSLATLQNRLLFLFCAAYRIPTGRQRLLRSAKGDGAVLHHPRNTPSRVESVDVGAYPADIPHGRFARGVHLKRD